MKEKIYNRAPLPFVGQKRYFLPLFKKLLKENIPNNGAGWTVVDAFGGSGLLAHVAKRTLPEARVIYNDFDGFSRRIALIPAANALRRELYAITQDLPKNGRIADADKARMLAVIGRYPQPELVQTLAGWLLFSGRQVSDLARLKAAGWYNRVPKTDITPAEEPFWELLPRFSDSPNTLLVLDPPYVSTAQRAYNNDVYFGMVQFLRLAAMVRPPFMFFSSTRSEFIDYLQLIVTHKLHNWQDWAGYQTVSLTVPLNYSSKYTDNMVYKF